MDTYYLIVLFIFGTIFGSFFNVVGYRIPRGESIVSPPSRCPKCDHRLTILELVPILSYIFQLGRCKNCKQPIPPFYAIFEFSTGVLFALSYYIFGFSYEFIIALIFSSMCIILIISDFHFFIIPDEILVAALIPTFLVILISNGISGFVLSFIGGLIGFAFMFAIKVLGDYSFKKESMGGGDIKLMFVFGVVLGYEMAVISIVVASFIGLPISLILLFNKKLKDRVIPFGPFLCVAALILLFGEYDMPKFLDLVQKVSLL